MLRRLAPAMVVMLAVLAACQSAPAYTDPTDIITKGIEATTGLNSFHMSVELTGKIKMSQTGGTVDLSSTTFDADVDITGRKAHLAFALPTFFGLSGDVVLIGKDLWVKTSMGSDKYSHMSSDVVGSFEPSASPDTAKMVKGVKDFLAKDGVEVKKLADVACGDRQCYQVSVSIPSSLMKDEAGAVASLDPSTVFGDALVLNLLFDREKLWLTEVSTDVASATMGTFSVTLSFSNFDEAVTVSPPPDAEVTEGEFTLPGM